MPHEWGPHDTPSESEIVNDEAPFEQFCAFGGVRYWAPNAIAQQIGCFLACDISDVVSYGDIVVAFLKRISVAWDVVVLYVIITIYE